MYTKSEFEHIREEERKKISIVYAWGWGFGSELDWKSTTHRCVILPFGICGSQYSIMTNSVPNNRFVGV